MSWFKKIFKRTEPKRECKPTRRKISDVKVGEKITIEWSRIKGGIGALTCLNNDIENKKILLQVKWFNYQEVPGCEETEKIILDYNAYELRNFALLNQQLVPSYGERLPQNK